MGAKLRYRSFDLSSKLLEFPSSEMIEFPSSKLLGEGPLE
jgi:hypothetical protein